MQQEKERVGDSESWAQSHPLRPLLPLAWELFKNFVLTGPMWVWMLLRLIVFAVLLAPAWMHVAVFYLTSENIKRNIRYGVEARNFQDIYYPDMALGGKKAPVLIFFCGGAWIIGYKAWGALFAHTLCKMGVVCVVPDYRNFPQGDVGAMLDDVSCAIAWTKKNIQKYGGDPDQVYLAGQSAGAHLGAMALLQRLLTENSVCHHCESSVEEQRCEDAHEWKSPEELQWRVEDISGFIGISGPYDLLSMQDHFHKRGLHREVIARIFQTEERVAGWSPLNITKQEAFREALAKTSLPPMYLFHGTADVTCPYECSVLFLAGLRDAGVESPLYAKYYHGKTHTDLILEDLMHDDMVQEDDLLADVAEIVHGRCPVKVEPIEGSELKPKLRRKIIAEKISGLVEEEGADELNVEHRIPVSQTLVSGILLRLARLTNPF